MAAPMPPAPPESAPKMCSSGGQSGPVQRSCSPRGSLAGSLGSVSSEAHVVNARLVEELRSVVVMNDKWQKYHRQQKETILELQGSLEEQRARTREVDERCAHLLASQQRHGEEVSSLEETVRCISFEAENERRDRERLESEIKELKESQQPKGHEERNNHLQFQLQLCIEDFKKEEADKKKLQREVSSLSTKLTEANRLLQEFREKVEMMQAIHFPSIGQDTEDTDPIAKAKLGLHKRRQKGDTPAHVRPCRIDCALDFPTSIEADSTHNKKPQRSFELAPKFSSSGSGGSAVSDNTYSDHDSLETQYDLIPH